MRGKTKIPAVKSTKDMRFSKWLKAELAARNMTQADLSRATGKWSSVINKLLRVGGTPDPPTVNAIADGLLIDREEIYRALGYLPPLPRERAQLERVKFKFSRLSPENQSRFERYLDFELAEQKREKVSKK